MTERSGPIQVFINPDLMDLLPAYLRRREGDVEHLQTFIANLDFDSIQKLGHKLCGNGSIFGFDRISTAGKDLTAAAVDRDMTKVRECTRELGEYLANLEICPMEKNENA